MYIIIIKTHDISNVLARRGKKTSKCTRSTARTVLGMMRTVTSITVYADIRADQIVSFDYDNLLS